MKKIGMAILAIALGMTACKNKRADENDQNNTVSEGSAIEDWEYDEGMTPLPLNQKIDTLLYGIDSLKKASFASEETKFDSGEKLIDEFAQGVEGVDAQKLKATEKLLKEMQLAVYNQTNMDDEDVMLAYDEVNEKFMVSLSELIENTPDFKRHARAKLLYQEIISANEADFLLRKGYNEKVNEYNRLIDKKRDQLDELGEKYQNLKPKVIFYGEPAS